MHTLVVRAHLDFEIVVNQDVTEGNWGQHQQHGKFLFLSFSREKID